MRLAAVDAASGELVATDLGAVLLAPCELDNKLIGLWLFGKSAGTVLAYRADVDRFFRFTGRKQLELVTLQDLQAFASSLNTMSPASRARKLNALKSLLTFGRKLGMLRVDVGQALILPKLENRLAERILADGEVQRMLALEQNRRNHALLKLLYQTGLRVSEACALTWRNLSVNGNGGQASVFGKGGKTRVVLLQKNLWRLVMNLSGSATPDEPVFRSRKGAKLDQSMVNRIVKAAAVRAGVSQAVSPHWFRHAHASHALDRGAPVHLVQQTLGHSSLETTSKYVHARPGESSGNYLPD